MKGGSTIRWPLLLASVAGIAAAFWVGQSRVEIDSDLVKMMPRTDAVLSDAMEVMSRNPALDRIAIDLSLPGETEPQPDKLVLAAQWVRQGMERSGLFKRVGLGLDSTSAGSLFSAVISNLPLLFSEQQLQSAVGSLIHPPKVRGILAQRMDELAQLSGIGQADALSKDPLGLRDLALARLSSLMPNTRARIYREHLLSADQQHLLLVAMPKASGSDTAAARDLVKLFDLLAAGVNKAPGLSHGSPIVLTVAGGFRAALDNETLVRGDTHRALILVTIGIALLLALCFPRPLIGLLALIPAGAGLALALLIYSLLERRISALALGFGGALVSITVDHGIAYLMFLDRTTQTSGKRAAQQIWSVGLFAVLTTTGAFLVLCFSGFPILEQVGLIAALGIALSFAFVHLVFPLIFPCMPPARRSSWLPVEALMARLTTGRRWWGPVLAALMAAGLLPFARPVFNVDLNAMNTVTPETLQAEETLKRVWGDVFNRIYVLLSAEDVGALQQKGDAAVAFLAQMQQEEQIPGGFATSMLLPGRSLAQTQFKAWQGFWTTPRQARLRQVISESGTELGFAPNAFEPFFASLSLKEASPVPIPAALYELMGISKNKDGSGYIWIGSLQRGPSYDADSFARRASAAGLKVLDMARFSQRLGQDLSDIFQRMLLLIAAAVVGLLVVLFFDLALVLLSLLPLAFAMICTLGTLKLLGLPIDIPGLMLVIVVFGMGIDYSLFLVRSHQRFLHASHPSQGPIRTAVFLAASSTLLGMASLTTAQHAVPRSAGTTAALGIAFSALGAFLILPPFLRRLFAPIPDDSSERRGSVRARVARRFRHLEPSARLSAWFKVRLDPMFPRLGEHLGEVDTVLDVGSGYGIPAAWLLERFPSLKIHACEPDPDRARVCEWVLGSRGTVTVCGAPDLPPSEEPAGAALLLDVIHHLPDEALAQTLRALHHDLSTGGRLIIRATVPSDKPFPWERRLEALRLKRSGTVASFRSVDQLSAFIKDAGFTLQTVEPTAPGREETWFVALKLGS